MPLDPKNVFRCVPLACKLSRHSCAERHVRAEALQSDGSGSWVPQRWANLGSSCRGCAIGKTHADLYELSRPPIPELPTKPDSYIRPVRRKKCDLCKVEFQPTSNRQKKCPECSTSRRYKKLREQNLTVCLVCAGSFSATGAKPRICSRCIQEGRAIAQPGRRLHESPGSGGPVGPSSDGGGDASNDDKG